MCENAAMVAPKVALDCANRNNLHFLALKAGFYMYNE